MGINTLIIRDEHRNLYTTLFIFLVAFLFTNSRYAHAQQQLPVLETAPAVETSYQYGTLPIHQQLITKEHTLIFGDLNESPYPDSLLFFQPVTKSDDRLIHGVDTFNQQSQSSQNEVTPANALKVESLSQTKTVSLYSTPFLVIGTDDSYRALADQTLSIAAPGFLSNDLDLDGEPLTATAILDNVDNGTLSAFADGSFNYTPNPGFTGTDSFVYRMRDASNNLSDSVTVTIEVIEGDRNPIGTDDSYTLLSETTLSTSSPGFLGNDIDPDGDTITATAILDNVDNGTLSAFADGSFNYTPDPGFTGTDSFVYRMRDDSNNLSDSVTVTLEVIEGNRDPIGTDDTYAAVENTTLSIATPGFLSNDNDQDGEALTATAILDNVDNGTLSAFADGSFNYTPDPGFTGTDSFVYRMRDASNNLSDSVTVTIQVLPAGTTPVGIDDVYKILADQTFSVSAPGYLSNDIDLDGEPLTATAILDNVDNGTLSAFADGSFNYTPDPGFTGTDSFVYRMRDASNNLSDSVTVTLEVIEGNRNPVGTDDAYKVLANQTLSISTPGFLSNDVDPDGESLTATAILDNVDNGTLSAFADGSFNYTPDPGFIGTDSFVYRMRDASNNISDSVTVTLDVIESNRNPIGTDDKYAALENSTLSIAAPGYLTNDIDPDGEALTATAILDNVDNGTLSAFADGSFNYTPDPDFKGSDEFVYRMRDDSNNLSDSVNVAIRVFDSDPEPPVADAGSDQTVECTSPNGATVVLDASDSSDPDGDTLTYTWRENSSVIAGPTMEETVEVTLELGVHEIELSVNDGFGGVDIDSVTVTVEDTTPPELIVRSKPVILWPPDHTYHKIKIDQFIKKVSDKCDDNLSKDDVVIASVTSDEPENEKGDGDGNTINDIIIGNNFKTVDLRAERSGNGTGRVYTIYLGIQDHADNVSIASIEVQVPVSLNSEQSVINEGAIYTVDGYNFGAGAYNLIAKKIGQRDLPEEYKLGENYPNPFNPKTNIRFDLPKDGHVTVMIYDILGRRVKTLVDQQLEAGSHTVSWDATQAASGTYIYRMMVGEFSETRLMMLVK